MDITVTANQRFVRVSARRHVLPHAVFDSLRELDAIYRVRIVVSWGRHKPVDEAVLLTEKYLRFDEPGLVNCLEALEFQAISFGELKLKEPTGGLPMEDKKFRAFALSEMARTSGYRKWHDRYRKWEEALMVKVLNLCEDKEMPFAQKLRHMVEKQSRRPLGESSKRKSTSLSSEPEENGP